MPKVLRPKQGSQAAASALDATSNTSLDRFSAAMDDDLDTPGALAALDELAARIIQAAAEGKEVAPAQESLRLMAQVFGFTLEKEGPEPRIRANWEKHLARFQSD